LRDALLLVWHCHIFFHQQLSRQFTDKRRHGRLQALAISLARASPEQDSFLLGPGQPDVEQPTFFGQVGTSALHREEALFHATHEDHGKL